MFSYHSDAVTHKQTDVFPWLTGIRIKYQKKSKKSKKKSKNPYKIQKLSKRVKKIRKSEKIPKNLKNHFFYFFFIIIFFAEKKCYSLSFPILGGRGSTRALQSSPFQNPGGVP